MDTNRIIGAIADLTNVIEEETGLRNPITKLGFSYEFFDYFYLGLSKDNNIRPSDICGASVRGIPFVAHEQENNSFK